MTAFAGIDWGGAYHQAAVVDDLGRELVNRRFAHDRAGVDGLVALLGDHDGLVGVAVERSEGLLVERLLSEGFAVFAVSPRVSAAARERHQAAVRKSDRFDAFVLADLMRTDGWKWRPLAAESALQAELRAVTRHRRQCVDSQIAVEAQLRETLVAYHPAVTALFSSVDRDATIAFLRGYPTPEAAGRVGDNRMAGFCSRIGYSGRVPAGVLAERLRANLLCAAPGSVAGHSYAALALADQLELLNHQIRSYNRRIGALLADHPDHRIIDSFPAVGRVTAAELISEIGEDRGRYPTAQALLAEAGAAPVTLSSGKIQRVRVRRACNRRLRAATTSWAYTLKRIDPVSAARYAKACERGATKHTALRAVASSWLRVLWRCWQDRTLYDPAIHRPDTPR
ncbi:IS110 family transposase [Candidatus Poriferisodalis sp.]|uniref:IS110 family transposase n=1 Tax=Candidatus Poriferisodalis sp. TaxID=3101277 RepID=UPI003B02CEA5